jgi:hypothetical protein
MNINVNESVRRAALKTKVGKTVNGEQLRERAMASGTTTNNPTDWGRAVSRLIKAGILTPTGDTVRASSPQARGRQLTVYTRNSARASVTV